MGFWDQTLPKKKEITNTGFWDEALPANLTRPDLGAFLSPGGVGNTTPSLPSPTQPATVPLIKSVAQGVARIPAEFAITAGQAGFSLVDQKSGTDFTARTDKGIPTGSAAWLLGEAPVKGYASQMLDLSETIEKSPLAQKYGIDTKAAPISFVAIGGLKVLDFFGGQAKPATAFLTTMRKIPNTAEGVADAYKVMRAAGFEDDIAKQYAPIFAKTSTAKGTDEIAEAAVRLQNTTKSVTPPEGIIADVPKAPVITEALQSIARKAAAMTADDFAAGFEAGLKSQNLTKRETAQNVLREMQTAGFKTPEEFYTAVKSSIPEQTRSAIPSVEAKVPVQLIEEARKYKSAEEFVGTRGTPLYHFTDEANLESINKNGIRATAPSEGSISEGISLATKRTEANEIFGNAKVPVYVSPEARSITIKEALDKMGFADETDLGVIKNAETKAPQWAAQNGYDILDMRAARGAVYKGMDEVRVLNPDVIQTKSQLTDIYNQAIKAEYNPINDANTPKLSTGNGQGAARSAGGGEVPGGTSGVQKAGELPVDAPRFAKAAKESPEFTEATKAEIELRSKQKVTNKETEELAKNRVSRSPDEAARFVFEKGEKTAEHTATGIELMRYYDARGNHKAAADVAESLADDLVKAGQTIQAAKLMQRLSPESVLIMAQKEIAKVNKALLAKGKEPIKLEDDLAEELVSLAKRRDETTDSLLKEELGWEIASTLASLKQATIGEKVSMIQTLAQLLNPKTILVRNPLGNEIFYRFERLNKYIATPIDFAKSKLTGSDRSVTFRTAGEQGKYWQNFIRGAQAGWRGVIPGGLPSQLDIGRQVFKSKYNPFYWGEKMLGAALRGFDFAAYSRAKNQTLGELGYLQAINEGKKGSEAIQAAKDYVKNADDNLLQIADDYGKYVTFQDDNMLSRGFQAVKRGLNANKAFGLGDLVLKYPRTPGSLLMRAIEYSPAGFLRSAYILAQPFTKGGPLNNRELALAVSRAITGTLGLTGMGYYLADKGIITGRSEDDTDIQALDRQTGTGKYKINISALRRFISSGFKDVELQEGDTLFSYDWAQPVAVSLAIGANINDQLDDEKMEIAGVANAALSSLESGVNTIAEQPLLQGLKRIFGYGDLFGGLTKIVTGAPASFVPTISNQLNQWIDNTRRNAYDPNALIESMNYAKTKVPGFAQTVNPMVTTFGETAEVYQGNSNNFFNVFFNPGFLSKYATTPESQLVLDVIEATGKTSVAPRIAPKDVDGVPLTAEEYESWQRSIGENIGEAFTAFAESEAFMALPDKRKASMMEAALTEVGKIAEDEIKGTSEAPSVTWKDRLTYQEVQYMAKTGEEDKAVEIVESMSDEEYERYKSVRTGERQRNTTEMRKLLTSNPVDAVQFVRSQDPAEAERLIGLLTEEEYALYEQGKQPSFTEE